jgi:uncharacterized protein (DUF362 family)
MSRVVKAPFTAAEALRLITHAEAGRVPKEHATAIRSELARAKPDLFGDLGLKTRLEGILRKVEEGAISIPMMAFGWSRELWEGTASIIRGRGTIRGPVPAELKAINKTGVSSAGVVSIDPTPAKTPAAERAKVYAAQKQAIDSIGGFDFLNAPPKGKTANEHTVLVKPGVNWGVNGYPTCTSAESTYATAKQALEEGDKRGAKVKVVIGDESGIEGKSWGATTMGNFELSGVLDGGVRAGLERAVALEAKGDPNFKGAKAAWDGLTDGHGKERKVTLKDTAAIAMAKKAGVELVGFEDLPSVRVPVPDIAPGKPGNKHFPDGILIPKFVQDEVTDIINVPKPPGRHALMGCAGLSGAMKNHIGLLASSDRVPMLHGPLDRVPGLSSGTDGPTWAAEFKEIGDKLKDPSLSRADRVSLLKKLQGQAHWDLNNENGPNMMLHEKIAELTSVFADKERFSVADMRRTVSSIGPDIGDTMDVGKVVASKDAATVDVLANALLKNSYDHLGEPKDSGKHFDLPGFIHNPVDWLKATLGNADTPTEYFYGRTWLEENATAFDTLQIRAAMAYGLTPLDPSMISIKTGDKNDPALSRVRDPG